MKRKRRKISELNLINGFLFNALLSHEIYGPRTAHIILSTVIGRNVQIRKLETEKIILSADTDRHGIRLDAYVEEAQTDVSQGDYFDIEPENKRDKKQLLPKRSRYYHSCMDRKILKVNELYDKLPNTWVIFITSFDPFGEERMVYTIKNRCVELPDMDYDDGATTLFLNVTGKSEDVSQDLKELLVYIRNTTSENAVNPKLKEIQEGIDYIKAEPSVREAYMTLGEYIKSEVDEEVAEIVAEVHAELDNARAEADNARAEADNARAEADNARAEADNARAEADNARAEAAAVVAEVKSNLLSAEAEIEKLKAELKKYRRER